MIVRDPVVPNPDEACRMSFDGTLDGEYHTAPSEIVEQYDSPEEGYSHDGRLVERVRELARRARRERDGHLAVLEEAALRLVAAGGSVRSTDPTPVELYTADFSVTGRAAYGEFQRNPPSDADMIARVRGALRRRAGEFHIDRSAVTDSVIEQSVHTALNRAYRVAWAMRGNPVQRAALRATLGWIGVSGEDDKPDRPVNVPGASYPQHEIDVDVQGHRVRTRYMISLPSHGSWSFDHDERGLPPGETPEVPDDHEVILFLHGHSSRLEEAMDLVPHLHAEAHRRDKRYAIISLDLPGSGYTEASDHAEIAPVFASRYNHPILRFLEEFVVAFVRRLDRETPIIDRIAAVIGGSLGGNLSLRLGRWAGSPEAWLKAIVPWSAASIWSSVLDYSIIDPGGLLRREAADRTADRAREEEMADTRKEFFRRAYTETTDFLWFNILKPQPEHWYRDEWQPCKDAYIAMSRADREETYDARFRRWHWRIANEQVIFSHLDPYTPGGHHSYELINARTLLAAGEQDNYRGTHLYERTQDLGRLMVHTTGETLLLRDTGHSIHNERPAFFAKRIVRFLNPRGCMPLPPRIIRSILEGLRRRG